MMKKHIWLLGIFILCQFVMASKGISQTYTVTNIGTLGGATSVAVDLNENGYVIGNSENSQQNIRGFVYKISDGSKIEIGTFGGRQSFVNAINNNQVVGRAETSTGDRHAFLYDLTTGILTDLHSIVSFGGAFSSATGINDQGIIVGWAELPNGDAHGFVYNPSSGVRTEIGTFGGANSILLDINENGIVTGEAEVSQNASHAFYYKIATAELTDIGTLGGSTVETARINNSNQIVGGSATAAGGFRGFRTGPLNTNLNKDLSSLMFSFQAADPLLSTVIDPATDTLPTLGGSVGNAKGINDLGDVVGQADQSDGLGRAFLYRNGNIINLNSLIPNNSGWELWDALAINNRGQIVGFGIINNVPSAFLLVPLAPTAAYVSVSGSVRSQTGKGVYMATVTITDSFGVTRSALTNPFGYYRFTNVQSGGIYIFNVNAKCCDFMQPSQVRNIIEDTDDVNFTALN
jgi:probable HAF family extracellular repeat protein